jgi:hypothetical protein
MRLIERLASLNRKERYYVVAWALGNSQFSLCSDFREQLSSAVGLPIPADAYVAMDYHLDWLYAALYLSAEAAPAGPYENQGHITAEVSESVWE